MSSEESKNELKKNVQREKMQEKWKKRKRA